MASKTSDNISALVKVLPGKPGVYQFYDREGKVIYIGKAKHLKKRVASYFNKDHSASGKLKLLVKKIADIKHIVVESEMDAFLLENNLIKKYQPRYNVMLKDDKTFPWICIKNEPFPRIFSTRNVIQDGSQYFGPYASVRMMNTVLELIRQLYPLRNCKLKLSEENIKKKKFKVCLEYHIGNCKGPCEGLQSQEEYDQSIKNIKEIIKGNIHNVITELKSRMMTYASDLSFERAHVIKEKLELLQNYRSKSTVVNPSINNVDIFSIITDDEAGYVNYMKVAQGAIVQAHTVEMKKKLDEPDDQLLSYAVTDLRQRFNSDSNEIIVPIKLNVEFPDIKITIPQRGNKKHLLELSERNANYYRLEKLKAQSMIDPERHTKRILEQMQKDLRMNEKPGIIECFDNSNIQGTHPVAAMVRFTNVKPDKKEYRHFNIRTVEGPDDYASMEEIVYRRYKRLLSEGKPLPQLIIVDGGKGQLSAALKSIDKLGLRGKITLIGIAKKLEEIYFPKDSIPLYLDKKSETLKLIQNLRDEAHRFGITHHRKKRDIKTIKSVLTDINGVGYETAQKLLWKFKSVKKIKQASLEDLQQVVGKAKGLIVHEFFKKQS